MKTMRQRTTIRGIIGSALVSLVSVLALYALITGFSGGGLLRAVELAAVVVFGAGIVTSVVVLSLVHFANWHSPVSEEDFEAVVRRAERLAAAGSWGASEDYDAYDEYGAYALTDEEDFDALVRSAIDELPLEFHAALEHVAVVVSDDGASVRTGWGRRRGAYGLYQGDTIVQNYFHDRIVIFRDTLMRDFGYDSELLREQVVRTLRHELAHHLGWDEKGVQGLGL